MKYDQQLPEVQSKLTSSQSVLIILPANCGVDCLASGLAFFLALKNSPALSGPVGKFVSIVSASTLRVAHTNLFGVGSVQNQVLGNRSGTWVLTIGGAVGSDGKAVFEKVDYSMQGSDLKLKFPIVPGQSFEPTYITPAFEGGSVDLILVIGAANLESLGSIYSQNQDLLTKSYVINIDNSPANNQFGSLRIVDPQAATLSEMVGQLIVGLGLTMDADIASNILAGIYDATGNLQGSVSAESFEIVARALKAGGSRPRTQTVDLGSQTPAPVPVERSVTGGFDLSQIYAPSVGVAGSPQQESFTVPSVVPAPATAVDLAPNTHEREPGVETTQSGSEAEETIEPSEDWLTPKVYSGKSIG